MLLSRMLLIFVLGLVVTLTGCKGNGSNHYGDSTTGALSKPLGKKVACPALKLSKASAVPGETITIMGVPKSLGPVAFRVIATKANGDKVIIPQFSIAGAPEGVVKFPAPFDPANLANGGDLKMEMGDGTSRCPDFAFHVEPLPANVPGDYGLTIQSKLEQFVDKALTHMGYDPATLLAADPKTLPKSELSAWLVKHLVSSKSDDNALPTLMQKATNDKDKTLERILKASHIEQVLDDVLINIDTYPTGQLKPRGTTNKHMPAKATDNTAPEPKRYSYDAFAKPQAQVKSSSCEEKPAPNDLQIGNTAELSYIMTQVNKNEANATAQAQPVRRTLSGVSAAVSVAKLAGKVAPGVGEIVAIVGGVDFVMHQIHAMDTALLPQTITSFSVDQVDKQWVEDRPSSNPLMWKGAAITAAGKDFSLSAQTGQAILKLAGAVPIAGIIPRVLQAFAPQALNDEIKEISEGVDCVRIRAPKYGPFDVDDEKWTDAKIIQGDSVALQSHQEYSGQKLGNSTLEISLKADQFNVKDTHALHKQYVIDVEPIDIVVEPHFKHVQTPGEPVNLTATAQNAFADPTLFDVTTTAGSLSTPSKQGSKLVVVLTTPTDLSKYPVKTSFKWTGKKLPPLDTPPRTLYALVDAKGHVEIKPSGACLLPGSTLQLTANLMGFTQADQGVTWSTSAGIITNVSGLTATLNAPAQTGTITVTVTANADPRVTDSAQYNVNQSCIKKAWFPYSVLGLEKGTTYIPPPPPSLPDPNCDSGEANTCTLNPSPPHPACPEYRAADDDDPSYAQALTPPVIPELPQLPPEQDIWYNRSESISVMGDHMSTRGMYVNDGTECSTIKLNGHNDSHVVYSASQDGTLSFHTNVDLSTDCEYYPDDPNREADFTCIKYAATSKVLGYYYITLGSKATYRLTGSLSCHSGPGNVDSTKSFTDVSLSPLIIGIQRYKAGKTLLQGSPGVKIPEPDYGDGAYSRTAYVLFKHTCIGTQTFPIDVTFSLDAPQTAEDDLIVIRIGGISDVNSGFGLPFRVVAVPEGFAYSAPPKPVSAGEHSAVGSFDFKVKLEQQ